MTRCVALYFGVNDYRAASGFSRLHYCRNDAELVERKLSDRDAQTFAIQTDTVTRADVERLIDDLKDEGLAYGDIVVFFFAGHGFSADGHDYIALSDSDINRLDTCMKITDIAARIRTSGAGGLLALLDCCRKIVTRSVDRLPFHLNAVTADELYDSTTVTGCSRDEYSQECADLGVAGHGVFSFALGVLLDEDPHLSLGQLGVRIREESQELCAQYGLRQQRPQVIGALHLADRDFLSLETRSIRVSRKGIILSGPTESGKSSIGQYLQQETGFTHVEMSSFVKSRQAEALLGGIEGSRDRQSFVERNLWGSGEFDIIAQDALKAISILEGGVIVSGPRRPEEVETLLASGIDFVQLYVEADSRTRWNRLLTRNDDFYGPERKDFIRRNLQEYGWGLAKVGTMPGVQIVVNEREILSAQQYALKSVARTNEQRSPRYGPAS